MLGSAAVTCLIAHVAKCRFLVQTLRTQNALDTDFKMTHLGEESLHKILRGYDSCTT